MVDSFFLIGLILFLILFLFILNFFCKKINLVDSGKGIQKIKSFKGVPLSGGLYFSILLIILNYNYGFFNIYLAFTFIILFFIGVLSDLEYIENPLNKFIFQIAIIIFFLFNSEIFLIQKTSVFFIDYFINNKYFTILFTSFCILICINGNNFIDGTNANSLLNSLLINLVFLYVIKNSNFKELDNIYFIFFLIMHIPFIISNFFNFNFLGDSGSYLIGFINAISAIYITQYFDLSPVFAVGILFYIWFENLFSFIRKKIEKKSPLYPDNKHLHMLIKNLINKSNINELYSSNLTSLCINFFNLPFFYLCFLYRNTGYIIFIVVLIQCLSYIFFYLLINKYVAKNIK